MRDDVVRLVMQPTFSLSTRRLHTVHKAREGDDSRLACGRVLTSSYSMLDDLPKHLPKCGICFGKGIPDPDESEEDKDVYGDVPSLYEHSE